MGWGAKYEELLDLLNIQPQTVPKQFCRNKRVAIDLNWYYRRCLCRIGSMESESSGSSSSSSSKQEEEEDRMARAFAKEVERQFRHLSEECGWRIVGVMDGKTRSVAKSQEVERRKAQIVKQKQRVDETKEELRALLEEQHIPIHPKEEEVPSVLPLQDSRSESLSTEEEEEEEEETQVERKEQEGMTDDETLAVDRYVHQRLVESKQMELERLERNSVRLTEKMRKMAQSVLGQLCIPYVEAPGDMEADHVMPAVPHVDAVLAADRDLLLYPEVSILIVKLEDTMYAHSNMEILLPEEIRHKLELTPAQMIDMCILVGTDYNGVGIAGLGAKRAHAVIRVFGNIETFVEAAHKRQQLSPEEHKVRYLHTPNVALYQRPYYRSKIQTSIRIPIPSDFLTTVVPMVRSEFARRPSSEFWNQFPSLQMEE